MFASIVLCALIVQLLFCKSHYKYFFVPPVLLTYIWIAVHVFNLLLGWQINEPAYLILVIPPVMFNLGFYINSKIRLSTGTKRVSTYTEVSSDDNFTIRYRLLYIAIIIDVVLMAWSLCSASRIIVGLTNANAWLNIHEGASMMSGNLLLSYSVPASYIFSAFCGIIYYLKKQRKLLLVYIISLIIALVRAFMAGNRTSLFMVLILNIFCILLNMRSDGGISYKKTSRKTKKVIIIASIVFCIMFFGIASQKYNDMFSRLPLREFLIKNFTGYFNLSSAAFVRWYNEGVMHTNGANTFRFVYAVANRLGASVFVADTNSSYIEVEGTVTNAFTVAKIYIEDFGIGFMSFMLFLYGVLHSHFYRDSFGNNVVKRMMKQLFCSALYIGLIGQVLGDQYITIASMMINFLIWSYLLPRVFLKTNRRY